MTDAPLPERSATPGARGPLPPLPESAYPPGAPPLPAPPGWGHSVMEQRPDGSYGPAEPIGWQEEHGPLARFVLWVRGIKHCCDDEGHALDRVAGPSEAPEDYTACGEQLMVVSPRYCEEPDGHEGPHRSSIAWPRS